MLSGVGVVWGAGGMGAQPGWGSKPEGTETSTRSIGYHGDDGYLYPGHEDDQDNFMGVHFG
eukprot:9468111-Pyramimonas_sp.AAC.4